METESYTDLISWSMFRLLNAVGKQRGHFGITEPKECAQISDFDP